MAGISDAAVEKLNSQNKFNGGAELEEDYGVNLYSTFYRRYDPQIGRFSGVDCQSEASAGMSVYQFGGNNPVSMNDPLGDRQVNGLRGGSNGYYYGTQHSYVDDNGNYWHHEDGLVGASSWMDGGPFDGGGGGSGPYLGYWNNLFNNSPNGATTYTNDPALLSLGDDPKHPYGYTSENNLGAFNTNVSHGDAFYDQEMDERFLLTSFKGLSGKSSGEFWNYTKEFKGLGEDAESVIDAGKYLNYGKFNTPGIGEWGYWADARGGFQSIRVTGNQFIGGRNAAKAFSKGFEKIAKPLGVLTTAVSAIEAFDDFKNGHTEQGIIHSTDTVMGVIGLTGWGAPIAAVYFVSRFFWGNEDD